MIWQELFHRGSSRRKIWRELRAASKEHGDGGGGGRRSMLELEDRSKRHHRSSHCFRKAVSSSSSSSSWTNYATRSTPPASDSIDGSVYHPVLSNLDNSSFTVSESLVRDLEYATTIPQIHPCRLKFCDEKKMNDEFGLTTTVIGFCGIARDTQPFGFVMRNGTIGFNEFQDAVFEAGAIGILRWGDVLVLDNKAIHRHKDFSLLEDVLLELGIFIMFMPTGSPDLNPMKSMWRLVETRKRMLRVGGMIMRGVSNIGVASMIIQNFNHADVDYCYRVAGYI